MQQEKALRYNEGKDEWKLVHFLSLVPMVRVLMYGAKKYAPDNWKKQMSKEIILNSLMRHATSLMDGETHDRETNLHHIGHIMCNCMFYAFHYVFNSSNNPDIVVENIELDTKVEEGRIPWSAGLFDFRDKVREELKKQGHYTHLSMGLSEELNKVTNNPKEAAALYLTRYE
jgi:hypothetical protein